MNSLTTVEQLAKAISKVNNIVEEEARMQAKHIMDMFGYSNEVIDHPKADLNDIRQTLYKLEDRGLVQTHIESHYISNKKQPCRVGYWKLNSQKICEIGQEHEITVEEECEMLYRNAFKEIFPEHA